MRRVNGALGADFFDLESDDFPSEIPFKNFFKIIVFPLWRQDLELQIAAICGAVLRSSIVFCNSMSADLSGKAASRFLVAAAARGIVLRFAGESRKSLALKACSCAAHVHGGMFKSFIYVKCCCVQKFLCAKACLVQKLLCLKLAVCKSFSVEQFFYIKASVCKSFSVWKLAVSKSFFVQKMLCVKPSLCKRSFLRKLHRASV